MSALSDWTPADGATVHLRRDNPWSLPAGRYSLGEWRTGRMPGKPCGTWDLRSITGPMVPSRHLPLAQLLEAERAGILTPIGADQLDREVQEITLRCAAPLRGNRTGAMRQQHDASGLALFRAALEPTLF